MDDCCHLSFRGTRKREPGIHFSACVCAQWIPGSRFARPGMTAQ
ncbi:hypothetical protein ACVJGD_006750 [Bradyrhizobium sp. USDA 10063]